jgi:hypothetical protein
MGDEITDETFEGVGQLVREFARLCDRTNTEVAHALLGSKTLRRYGYDHARQNGTLTEAQGQAAIQVLGHWIESRRD